MLTLKQITVYGSLKQIIFNINYWYLLLFKFVVAKVYNVIIKENNLHFKNNFKIGVILINITWVLKHNAKQFNTNYWRKKIIPHLHIPRKEILHLLLLSAKRLFWNILKYVLPKSRKYIKHKIHVFTYHMLFRSNG